MPEQTAAGDMELSYSTFEMLRRLIHGLCGLVIAGLVGSGYDVTMFKWAPPFLLALGALVVLALVMIRVPLANAGRPEDPAPPTAIM